VRAGSPCYDLIPKDPLENIQWRIAVGERARKDLGFRKAVLDAAAQDVLFFLSGFCWLVEPRPEVSGKDEPLVLPFVPWPHQEPAIRTIAENLGKRDIGIDKSRAEGASFICLYVGLLHPWLFMPMFSGGIVSRTEDAMDTPGKLGTLMPKLDWQIARLPFWMRPKGFSFREHRSLARHTLFNPELEGEVSGFATTGDVAAGDRLMVLFLDELARFKRGQDRDAMASTQHVTSCRLFCSTFHGASGAFFEAVRGESAEGNLIVVLDWADNPTKNDLLYTATETGAKPVDQNDAERLEKYLKDNSAFLQRLRRRGFWKKGRKRSPWYDKECARLGVTPHAMAEEVDRDPHGSVSKVFDTLMLEDVEADCCQTPWHEGRLSYEEATARPERFIPAEGGEFRLWIDLDFTGGPQILGYSFVLGADIASGTGGDFSSNSAMVVICRETGEQVAAFASNTIRPGPFCQLCVVVCRWFGGAYLVWEADGPNGVTFTRTLLDIGYGNVYFQDGALKGEKKRARRMGWWNASSDANKKAAMDLLAMAMEDRAFRPRDSELTKECRQFEFRNGKIVHLGEQETKDHAAKGKSHGDRVIAAMLAWEGVRSRPLPKPDRERTEAPESWEKAPPMSMAHLIWEAEEAQRHKDEEELYA
jgi:hypothetical protein